MLVKDWMSKTVVAVDADASMADAVKLLKEHHIRMLPVMSNGKLVGVVTDRDIKRASASDATTLEIHELLYLISAIKITEIMSPNPITVSEDYTVEETARILLVNRISGVPVTDASGSVAGVITQSDLFKVIISMTGREHKGIALALQTEDRPGAVTEAIHTIRNFNGRIMSILSSREQAPEGHLRMFIRMSAVPTEKLDSLLSDLSRHARLLYMINYQDNKRYIAD
ncbi:MAG: CBS and ACT domain-containing protein [Desulfobacterales bacterium]